VLTAVVFLLVLLSAVLIHELAHYLNARSVGLPVRAFSVGMGPVIARWQWRGTEWRISLLPIGGYVDIPGMAPRVGEDGTLQHPDEGFARAPWRHKVWVLAGGVAANYALGVALLAVAVGIAPQYRSLVSGREAQVTGSVIAAVTPGSIAESLGILPGDRLLSIGAVEDPTPAEAVAAIRAADGLTLRLQGSDGAVRSVVSPWPPSDGTTLLGVSLTPAATEPVPLPTAVAEAALFGIRLLPDMVAGFVRGFGSALTGRANEDVAGPIGMVTMVGQAAQVGVAPVLVLAAIINFSLMVFNLLPIPGLDGGRILLATVVALRRRPFAPGQEEKLHFVGIATVLLLILLITIQEIGGLIAG
jgi:regulator of sigma E protease